MSGVINARQDKATTTSAAPTRWERWKQALLDFWKKCSNDWIFNFSGLLAYALLMSIFPLFLVVLAIAGLSLYQLSPEALTSLANSLKTALPGQTGGAIVEAVLANLRRSTGWLFALGLLLALFSGSRLFITIESSLSVIFRLRPRDAIHQNIMAFSMVLLFVVLVPILFLASSASDAITQALFSGVVNKALTRALGILSAFIVAVVLFGAIYIVVPNRPVQWKEVWKGTLGGAGLLVLYELLFPLYQNLFLKPGNYGSVAGFAIVILVFFYYFAFILLLGAEVNSWASGQRQTASDLASIIHEVQAHNTTLGAHTITATDAAAGISLQSPITLKANWPMYGFSPGGNRNNPYETAISAANVAQLQLAWKLDTLTGGGSVVYDAPTIADGRLYIGGGSSGPLKAYTADTGAFLWQTNLEVWPQPAYGNGRLLVGANILASVDPAGAYRIARGRLLIVGVSASEATPLGGKDFPMNENQARIKRVADCWNVRRRDPGYPPHTA